MSRAAWLALGAIVSALVTEALGGVTSVDPGVMAAGAVASSLAVLGIGVALRRPGVAAVAAGGGLIALRLILGTLTASPPPDLREGAISAAEHQATVLSVSAPQGGEQRAVLELRPPEPAVRVYAWLPRYPDIVPTDLVRFDGRLEAAPTDGSFGDYLARSGISFTARPPTLAVVDAGGGPMAGLEQLRRTGAALISAVLPEPQAGLAAAMAIGLRDLVAKDVSDDFRTAGLSHVVAISGWHICLLAGLVGGLLGRLSRRRRSLVVLFVVCAYAILAGGSASVLRAAVMASVALLARESGRRGSAAAALSLTVVAMLVVQPATIADVGFQLSAAATAGLLVWAAPLRAWLAARAPRLTPGWLLEALAVSLAAQAATLPLVLLTFGRLSLVAPLANLLVAPIVAPVMLLIALAFVCGLAVVGLGAPALLCAPLTLIASLGIGSLITIAHVAASLPFAAVTMPPPLDLAGAGLSALAIAFVVAHRRRSTAAAPPVPMSPRRGSETHSPRLTSHRLAFGASLGGLCLLLAVVGGARPDGRLHLDVLDVGQGDAILVEGPDGGRMLVDTGPDPDRLVTLLDERLPPWDRRIDMVVITHPHEDHIAGLALLLARYRVGEVAESGMIGPGPGYAASRLALAALNMHPRQLAAGDTLWLDGVRLDVDWPLPGGVPLHPANGGKAINNVSIVLDVHYGTRRALLTGDIEEEIDPQLLARGVAADGRPLDVLKVAHHGSATATTAAFLAALRPRIAVISVGWGNVYGHPAPATLARLLDAGAQVFRTDLDGSVEISTDGSDLIAVADGGRPRPTHPPPPGPTGDLPGSPRVARWTRRRTYNRTSVRPHARRSRRDPARVPAAAMAAGALRRGRRSRLVHRSRAGPTRRGNRHDAGRNGGAAPRHRQGAGRRPFDRDATRRRP